MAPKHLMRVVIAASIVIVLAVVTAVVVVMSGGTKSTQHDGPPQGADLVEIEVRSKPRAHVYYNLRDVGLSPVTLHVPRGTTPIDLAMSLNGKSLIKHIVPDHPQTVDFFVPPTQKR